MAFRDIVFTMLFVAIVNTILAWSLAILVDIYGDKLERFLTHIIREIKKK